MGILDSPDYFGSTIFCDDIRNEIGGKATYVGVYKATLYVHVGFPVDLPKLGIAIDYFQRRNRFVRPVKFLIFLPEDREDAASIEIGVPEPEIEKAIDRAERLAQTSATATDAANIFVHIGLPFVFTPFRLKEQGRIRVRATRGDDLVRLGGLFVQAAPPKS